MLQVEVYSRERPSYEDDGGVWVFIFSVSGGAALRLTVLVCVSSSSDLTTGVSPPLALVWLSSEEFEDVEDMRDLASRPSRTCRKSPLLMTSSLLLFAWTVSQTEHIVRDVTMHCFVIFVPLLNKNINETFLILLPFFMS